jgi:hypothetical protein
MSIAVRESVVGETQSSTALASLQPGVTPFRIVTMKGLYIRSIPYSRYYYNLICEASWIVETGTSSTQDKSRIVNIILPFIMKHCTDEDMRVLSSSKPDSSSPEYDVWNTSLRDKTIEIEKRLEKILERDEDTYFPLRDKTKLRRKHMSVNGVEGRLAEINKMRKVKENEKRKLSTLASFCGSGGITSRTSTSLPTSNTSSDATFEHSSSTTIPSPPKIATSCSTSSSRTPTNDKLNSITASYDPLSSAPPSSTLHITSTKKLSSIQTASSKRSKSQIDLTRQKNVMDA